MNKVISVIIPVYNGEKFVGQCIDSLLYQTYKNLEIIVVDDGSTDRTAEIVEQFPVTLIKQKNKGVSAARNRGISESTGEYLHFIDADDYLNIHFYMNMIMSVVETNSDIACCSLSHELFPTLSTFLTDDLVVSNLEDKISISNVGNEGFSVKYLIRRSLIEKHNHSFDETLTIGEDLVFSYKLIYWANRVVSVPKAIYYYKNREGSAMTSQNSKDKINRKISLNRARSILDDFICQNNITAKSNPQYIDIVYKLFGIIPIFKKRTANTGRKKIYMFGVLIMRIKQKQ